MKRRETDVITKDIRSRTLVLLSMKILLPKELEPACAVDIVLTTVEQALLVPARYPYLRSDCRADQCPGSVRSLGIIKGWRYCLLIDEGA
jgi:hypothetical protein